MGVTRCGGRRPQCGGPAERCRDGGGTALPGAARRGFPELPLGLGSVLREIARDRSVVRLETSGGAVTGRIAAVGADALDIRSLPTGEPTTVPGSTRITVAFAALQALQLR